MDSKKFGMAGYVKRWVENCAESLFKDDKRQRLQLLLLKHKDAILSEIKDSSEIMTDSEDMRVVHAILFAMTFQRRLEMPDSELNLPYEHSDETYEEMKKTCEDYF